MGTLAARLSRVKSWQRQRPRSVRSIDRSLHSVRPWYTLAISIPGHARKASVFSRIEVIDNQVRWRALGCRATAPLQQCSHTSAFCFDLAPGHKKLAKHPDERKNKHKIMCAPHQHAKCLMPGTQKCFIVPPPRTRRSEWTTSYINIPRRPFPGTPCSRSTT